MKDWVEGPSPQYIGKESVPPGIAHCQRPRQTTEKERSDGSLFLKGGGGLRDNGDVLEAKR